MTLAESYSRTSVLAVLRTVNAAISLKLIRGRGRSGKMTAPPAGAATDRYLGRDTVCADVFSDEAGFLEHLRLADGRGEVTRGIRQQDQRITTQRLESVEVRGEAC